MDELNKIKQLKSLKSQFKIINAEEARKKIEEKIYTDPIFIYYSETLVKDLENAIKNGNNKIIFKKHTNELFNNIIKNTLINKGYNVSEDIIVKYKNNFNDYDKDYTETNVFIIEF